MLSLTLTPMFGLSANPVCSTFKIPPVPPFPSPALSSTASLVEILPILHGSDWGRLFCEKLWASRGSPPPVLHSLGPEAACAMLLGICPSIWSSPLN